jgi:hypothetical protein
LPYVTFLGIIFYIGLRAQKNTRALEIANAELIQLKFAINEHAIVSATDVHGNITDANDKFMEISGYRREEKNCWVIANA